MKGLSKKGVALQFLFALLCTQVCCAQEAPREPVARREVGMVRAVGQLEGASGFPWGIVVRPEERGQRAQLIDLRFEGASGLFTRELAGKKVEVVGNFIEFSDYGKHPASDVMIGEIPKVLKWRIVGGEQASGVWLLSNGRPASSKLRGAETTDR